MSKTKPTIYIEVLNEENGCFAMSIESLLITFVFECCESTSIDLKLLQVETSKKFPIKVDLSHLTYSIHDKFPKLATYCVWPIIIVGNKVIAGLSAVARQIIRSSKNVNVRHLLGFRESCLMACSEASIWTMFCEVDMPQSVSKLLENLHCNIAFKLPDCFSRFQYHMQQPVRIHNMYKVARIQNKKKMSSDTPKNELNLLHTYAEGPTITISDVILFPCIDIFFKLIKDYNLNLEFPLIHKWYVNMLNVLKKPIKVFMDRVEDCPKCYIDDDFIKQSLYKSDMSHYKMQKKTYTKQSNIERSLDIINSLDVIISNSNSLFGSEVDFDWNNIPTCINPCGGALPEKRADRKCEQLESMAKPVIKLAASSEYTIVDFCSGSGHLGLLLAYLLPKCQIILVENKEKSLDRAEERIQNLQLKNVTIVQSNLDYFSADFDIGVALHACGTATDLVMQTCINKRAHFVCCPCCYGGIKECHLVNYPRSAFFKSTKLTYKDYMSLAHGADQTHDSENSKTKQGYTCMDVIDTDRKLYAEHLGYDTFLGKLQPVTCTNKNNLIVGIDKKK